MSLCVQKGAYMSNNAVLAELSSDMASAWRDTNPTRRIRLTRPFHCPSAPQIYKTMASTFHSSPFSPSYLPPTLLSIPWRAFLLGEHPPSRIVQPDHPSAHRPSANCASYFCTCSKFQQCIHEAVVYTYSQIVLWSLAGYYLHHVECIRQGGGKQPDVSLASTVHLFEQVSVNCRRALTVSSIALW